MLDPELARDIAAVVRILEDPAWLDGAARKQAAIGLAAAVARCRARPDEAGAIVARCVADALKRGERPCRPAVHFIGHNQIVPAKAEPGGGTEP